MPDTLVPQSMESPDAQEQRDSALESRLSPEQISDLDTMNANAFGSPPPAAAPSVETPVADAPPNSTQAPPKPAQTPIDDPLLPPDLETAADGTKPPDEKVVQDELPEGKDILPDIEIEKFRTDKAKKDVGLLRTHYETARELIKKHTARIAELESKVSAPNAEADALVASLEARVQELNSIVESTALTKHPWVQKTFTQPRKDALERASSALELADIAPEQLKRALSLEGKDKVAALDDLYESIQSPSLRADVAAEVKEISKLDKAEAAFLANREGEVARLQQEALANRHKQTKEQGEALNSLIDKAGDYLAEKLPSFYKKSGKPEHAEWDKGIDADKADARELALHNEDPAKLVAALYLAARTPRIVAAYNRMSQLYRDSRAENAKLRGVVPPLNGDRVPNGNGERTPPASNPNETLLGAGLRIIKDITAGG